MTRSVADIRQRVTQEQAQMLLRPAMWGTPDSVESLFLERLELLHFIDYPECKQRCGFNFYVSCSMHKYARNTSIVGCLRSPYCENIQNVARIMDRLVADLKEIDTAWTAWGHDGDRWKLVDKLSLSPYRLAEIAKEKAEDEAEEQRNKDLQIGTPPAQSRLSLNP